MSAQSSCENSHFPMNGVIEDACTGLSWQSPKERRIPSEHKGMRPKEHRSSRSSLLKRRSSAPREAELQLIMEELIKAKEQLAFSEANKKQLSQELTQNKKLVEELTFKLYSAVEASRKNKVRAEVMELACYTAAEDWKAELDGMSEQYDKELAKYRGVELEVQSVKAELLESKRFIEEMRSAMEESARRECKLSAELERATVEANQARLQELEAVAFSKRLSSELDETRVGLREAEEDRNKQAASICDLRVEIAKMHVEIEEVAKEIDSLIGDGNYCEEVLQIPHSSVMDAAKAEIDDEQGAPMAKQEEIRDAQGEVQAVKDELRRAKEAMHRAKSQVKEVKADANSEAEILKEKMGGTSDLYSNMDGCNCREETVQNVKAKLERDEQGAPMAKQDTRKKEEEIRVAQGEVHAVKDELRRAKEAMHRAKAQVGEVKAVANSEAEIRKEIVDGTSDLFLDMIDCNCREETQISAAKDRESQLRVLQMSEKGSILEWDCGSFKAELEEVCCEALSMVMVDPAASRSETEIRTTLLQQGDTKKEMSAMVQDDTDEELRSKMETQGEMLDKLWSQSDSLEQSFNGVSPSKKKKKKTLLVKVATLFLKKRV